MLEFIKMFGLGVLYTVLFPFMVLLFSLNLIYSFISYLVLEGINLFGFFFGYSFSTDTDLDIKLKEIKKQADVEKENSNAQVVYAYSDENKDIELKGSDE